DHAHALGPGGEQARCPGPGRGAVQPPRLQHREPRRRPDRAQRDLPDDDRGQRRAVAAGAGHQAAEQARRGDQDRRARPGTVGGARAAAGQGEGRREHPRSGPRGRAAVPREGRRRGHRRGDRPDRRQHRQARRLPACRRALRGPRARAVRDGRDRPGLALDHRAHAAPDPHAGTAGRRL
ncbi:MAG: Acetolactate synthase small subunit, partial [uncultured Nocardioidaceae bacterium]